MACVEFKKLNPDATDDNVATLAYEQGTECALQYYKSERCDAVCSDLTRNSEGCFNCLSDINSCKSSSDSTKACCPNIKEAVECSQCQNKGDDCDKDSDLSTTYLILILAGVGLFVLITIIVFVVVVKKRKYRKARDILQSSNVRSSGDKDIDEDLAERLRNL